MLKDENGKILTGAAEREAWHTLHKDFLKAVDHPSLIINIKFIKAADFPINKLDYIINQLVVMFDSGELMILPRTIVGRKANRYLGFRLTKVKYWGILPVIKGRQGGINCIDLYPETQL